MTRVWLQRLLLLTAAVIVGALGIFLGTQLRQSSQPVEWRASETKGPPPFVTEAGKLPNVTLLDMSGNAVASKSLYEPYGGAIVLFIDLGCPPCSLMAARWDTAVAMAPAPVPRLVAITADAVDRVNRFRAALGLRFPVYADTGHVYENTYGVAEYPLRLVIGPEGNVFAHSFDSREVTDVDAISRMLFRPRR